MGCIGPADVKLRCPKLLGCLTGMPGKARRANEHAVYIYEPGRFNKTKD